MSAYLEKSISHTNLGLQDTSEYKREGRQVQFAKLDLDLTQFYIRYQYLLNWSFCPLIIRTLRENELKHARQLLAQIFVENGLPSLDEIREKHQKYPPLFIGGFNEKELVGTVFGWPEPDVLVVKAIVVAETYRRKRIGTKLLKSFERVAIGEGFESMVLGARWEAVPLLLRLWLRLLRECASDPG